MTKQTLYNKNQVFNPSKIYLDGYNNQWEVEEAHSDSMWLVNMTTKENEYIELVYRSDGKLYGPTGFVEKNS